MVGTWLSMLRDSGPASTFRGGWVKPSRVGNELSSVTFGVGPERLGRSAPLTARPPARSGDRGRSGAVKAGDEHVEVDEFDLVVGFGGGG
jgi:hypothetical protein